ncbi:MAG: hypothetical protein GQE15_19325 [Archangiaceae bacterium]|nr:hypothetical protein [Archangiaceae bacterium]
MRNDALADLRLLETLPTAVGPTAPPPPAYLNDVQERWFPSRRGGSNAFVSNPLDVDALPKNERLMLERLCSIDCGVNWAHRGLPPDVRSRRRLLGLAKGGVLEELISCPAFGKGQHPRWKVLKFALDKYGRAYANKPSRPDTQAWLTKGFFELTPLRWLELWTELKARAYGITAWGNPLVAAVAAVSPAERAAWAERWCDEMLQSPERNLRDWVGPAIVASFGDAPVPARVKQVMKLKAAPPPKPARVVEEKVKPGQYVFFGRTSYDLAGIEALDARTKKQFLVAASKYSGKKHATPRAFFTWEAKETETSVDGVEVLHWKVALATAKKQPRYELWVFLVDNGTVFEAGSPEPLGIAAFQGRFVVEQKNRPELVELARHLQANVPF